MKNELTLFEAAPVAKAEGADGTGERGTGEQGTGGIMPPVRAPGGADELPEFITVEETASMLRLDRKTVYSMIERNELPGARRCGRTYRLYRPSVVSWFTAELRPVRRGGKR